MKVKFFSILFLLGLLLTPAFSSIFTMPEHFVYNNYFYSSTSQNIRGSAVNGWIADRSNGREISISQNGIYSNEVNAGQEKRIYQNLTAGFTGNVSVYLAGSLTAVCVYDETISVGLMDDDFNVLGSGTILSSDSYSGGFSGSINIDLSTNTASKVYISLTTGISNCYTDTYLTQINIYNTDETTSAYTFNATNPISQTETGTEIIQMDAYSGLTNDTIKFYFIPNSADNSTSQTFNEYDFFFNTADGDYFYNIWMPDVEVENAGVYVLNGNNNAEFLKNITFIKIDNLENFDLNYNSDVDRFEINFDIPTLLTGYNYNNYQIVIRKTGESTILKQLLFNDSGWSSGIKTFDGFTAEKTGGVLWVYYNYSFPDNNDDLTNPYITSQYKYKQEINSSSYLTSFFNYDYYTLSINFWKFYSTTTGNEYGSWDITFNDDIKITPTINDITKPAWSVEILKNNGDVYTYIPDSYLVPYYVNLTIGVNLINIKDSNGIIKKSAVITKYKLFEILNQTLLNSNFDQECYNNGSINDCDYNIMPAHFFTRSLFTEYFNLDGSGANIETDIYCKKNENLTLYYSSDVNCQNTAFIPSYQTTNYEGLNGSYYPSYLSFNTPISETTHRSLYEFLLNNSDLLSLNDWDFNQQVMNFYKNENCWDQFYYIPKNTECVLKQYYWTNLTNKESLNISFKATTSLLDDVKTNDIFFEMKSECKLNRFKTDLFGNQIPASALDYLGYYSCVINDFIVSNTMTAYYLGFIITAVIISKYLMDLFGLNKK